MAKIEIPKSYPDPTLEAVDRAIEIAAALELARPYLGASAIGDECARKLWYGFRWASKHVKPAFLVKCGERGHRGEDLQAKRLQMVPGVELIIVDPETGKQFELNEFGGHFGGHCDGKIQGILQAPKKLHIWEHKEKEEKFFNALNKAKEDYGEKNALKVWDIVYWAQAQIYMHYFGCDRHYLTCSTPGGRTTISVRTNADPAEALLLIAKAKRIIFAQNPPPRIAKDEEFYLCRLCERQEICWRDEQPETNCRTCLHSTPMENGTWQCAKFNCELPVEFQRTGCINHLYIPSLIPGEPIEAGDNFVRYKLADGSIYTNQGDAP